MDVEGAERTEIMTALTSWKKNGLDATLVGNM